MTNILQSKLAKKVVLLLALTAALAYLRMPGRLQAGDCNRCFIYLEECTAECATLGSGQEACDKICMNDFNSCLYSCEGD
jgi:hypothetical protein